MMSLFALAVIVTYDCETAKPVLVGITDGKVAVGTLGLPAEVDKWKFTVSIESGDPLQATIAWPGNPLKAEGKFPAMPTSKGSLAIIAASAGPCALTDGGCLTQVNLVNTSANAATVQVIPSALGKSTDRTIPLLVVAEGTCKRSGASQ